MSDKTTNDIYVEVMLFDKNDDGEFEVLGVAVKDAALKHLIDKEMLRGVMEQLLKYPVQAARFISREEYEANYFEAEGEEDD